MSQKLVSILIPNFNKEEYIVPTFESICNQSYQNWECIVVDDHSTDSSWKLLNQFAKKDQRFRILRRPDSLNKGGNSCRNYAYSQCQGEYIQWFDSDDIMLSHCLQDKVNFLEQHSDLAFVASKARIHYENDFQGPRKFHQNIESDNPIEDYLKFWILFITGGPLFRRQVFEKVGLFRLGLKKHQEWELFFRVILNYPKWGIINREQFIYLIHGNSISGKLSKSQKKLVNAEIIAIKTALDPSLNPFTHLIPKQVYKRFLLRYVKFCLIQKNVSSAFWFFKRFFTPHSR